MIQMMHRELPGAHSVWEDPPMKSRKRSFFDILEDLALKQNMSTLAIPLTGESTQPQAFGAPKRNSGSSIPDRLDCSIRVLQTLENAQCELVVR